MLIYLHTINNKPYVGQTTKTISKRLKTHINDAKSGSLTEFHTALRENGYKCDESIILENEIHIDELDSKEIYYIEKYNSYYNGYNMTVGGDYNPMKGGSHKSETILKMRESALKRDKKANLKNSEAKKGMMNAFDIKNKEVVYIKASLLKEYPYRYYSASGGEYAIRLNGIEKLCYNHKEVKDFFIENNIFIKAIGNFLRKYPKYGHTVETAKIKDISIQYRRFVTRQGNT